MFPSSIRFQWEALECKEQNGVLVWYKCDVQYDKDEKISTIVDSNSTSCIVTLPRPGRIWFSVAAVNKIGVGPYSSTVKAITQEYAQPVVLGCQDLGTVNMYM